MKVYGNRKCAVKNCRSGDGVSLHSFPNPKNHEAKYKKWLSLCGNYTLLKLKPLTVFRHKNVCEKHFEECCLSKTSGRLQRYTVPTLNLPDPIPPADISLWLPTTPQNLSTTVTPSTITLEPIWKDTTYNKSFVKPSLTKQVLPKKHVVADDIVVPSETVLDTSQAELEEAVSPSKQGTEDNETSAPPNGSSSLSTIQDYYYSRKRAKTSLKRKCSVKGCDSGDGVLLHSLPNPKYNEAKFKQYLSLCGNDTLLTLKPSVLLRHKNICEKHFKDCYINKTSGRLLKYAVPTLNLPEPIPLESITLPENSSTKVTPSAITLEPVWSDTTYNKSYLKPSIIKQILPENHGTSRIEDKATTGSSKQLGEYKGNSILTESSDICITEACEDSFKAAKINRKRKCSVKGCNSGDGIPLHSLPNPKTNEARFKQWLSLCGNDTLLKLKPAVILRRKNICEKHFKDCYINKMCGKLLKHAVPTLNLPEPIPLESITLRENSSTTLTPTAITLEPVWRDTTYDKSYVKPSIINQILPESHGTSRTEHKATTGSSKQLGEYKGNPVPTESIDLCITEACKDSYKATTKQNLLKCAVEVYSNGNDVPLYSFPNPKTKEARFKQWLSLPGNNALLKLKPQILYQQKNVSDSHFEDKSSELEKYTVSTKNLPEHIPLKNIAPSSIATVPQNSSTAQALSAVPLQAIWNDIKHSTSFEIILEHAECDGSMASTKCSNLCEN